MWHHHAYVNGKRRYLYLINKYYEYIEKEMALCLKNS